MSLNDLLPGTRVGDDYTIIEPLARGGMGVVYVALQESTNKRRALKVMTPQPGDPEALRRRFEQEARVSAQIESDHVVQIIGAGVDRDTNLPWLAMELLDGETLDARLERGPLGWMEAWRVIGELCHGLEAAHRLGVVHRDLKPCNVFLARSWRPGAERLVKILDFGIAKRVGDAGQTVGLLGTPLYMAPEQTMPGVALQPSTDVWGLGLLVFTILTGSSYWRSAGDSNTQIGAMLREIVLDPLPPATERARELGVLERLPAGFDLWFARCVVRDPAARFPDAGAAYRALEPLFADATRRAEDGYPPIPAAPTMPAFPVVATGAFPAVAPQAGAPVARGVMAPPPMENVAREKESLAPLAYEPSYVDESPWSEPPSIPKNHIAAKVFGVLLVGSAAAAFAAFTIMRQPDGLSLRPADERGEVVQAAAVPPPAAAPAAPAEPAPVEAAAAPVVTAAPEASAAPAPSAEASAEPAAAPSAEPKKAAPKAPPRARAPRRAAPPAPAPSPAPTDVPDTSSDFPYVSGPPGSEPPPASGDALPPVEDVYPSETPPEPAPAPEPEPPPVDPTPGKFDPGTI